MIGSDKDYYRERADAERRQAARSPNPAVRNIHLSLAEEYTRRAVEPASATT